MYLQKRKIVLNVQTSSFSFSLVQLKTEIGSLFLVLVNKSAFGYAPINVMPHYPPIGQLMVIIWWVD